MWEASDAPTPRRSNPRPSPRRQAAATLAVVVSLAVAAPVGPVAATSQAVPALAPGAGAALKSARAAPHPVDPSVATFPVRGVSPQGLAALSRSGRSKDP